MVNRTKRDYNCADSTICLAKRGKNVLLGKICIVMYARLQESFESVALFYFAFIFDAVSISVSVIGADG